jgi:hypothetical protein
MGPEFFANGRKTEILGPPYVASDVFENDLPNAVLVPGTSYFVLTSILRRAVIGRLTDSKGENTVLRKMLGRQCFVVMVVAVGFALTPASALAQKGGGGGGGGGGGSHDLPTLQAIFIAECADDPDAGGYAVAAPGPLGDGQAFSLQIDGIYSADVVSVYINGRFIGFIDIDSYGDGGSLYNIGYYGGGIPVIAPLIRLGDEIDIYDALDGTCLLTGMFQ